MPMQIYFRRSAFGAGGVLLLVRKASVRSHSESVSASAERHEGVTVCTVGEIPIKVRKVLVSKYR